MKRVKVFKWIPDPQEGRSEYEVLNNIERRKQIRVESYEGTFLEWGVEGVEYQDGAATCSTAIIMKPDGNVENVFVDNIQFILE